MTVIGQLWTWPLSLLLAMHSAVFAGGLRTRVLARAGNRGPWERRAAARRAVPAFLQLHESPDSARRPQLPSLQNPVCTPSPPKRRPPRPLRGLHMGPRAQGRGGGGSHPPAPPRRVAPDGGALLGAPREDRGPRPQGALRVCVLPPRHQRRLRLARVWHGGLRLLEPVPRCAAGALPPASACSARAVGAPGAHRTPRGRPPPVCRSRGRGRPPIPKTPPPRPRPTPPTGVRSWPCTLESNFRAPFIREYCLLHGLRSCARRAVRGLLRRPGNAVVLVRAPPRPAGAPRAARRPCPPAGGRSLP
jgi:hypothetical protein